MLRPEHDVLSRPIIGHAVLAIVGGSEDAPQFWAADFSSPVYHSDPVAHFMAKAHAVLGVADGLIQTTDTVDERKKIFNKYGWQIIFLEAKELTELQIINALSKGGELQLA